MNKGTNYNDNKKDKNTAKIRGVNQNFYDLPPKDRELLEQSCAGMAFDMKNSDAEKQTEQL